MLFLKSMYYPTHAFLAVARKSDDRRFAVILQF